MTTNMRSRDFFLLTVWFFLLITGITAATTDGPSNTVAVIGQQVNLSCTAENSIKWVLSKDGSANGQLTIVDEGCMVNKGFEDHYETQSLNAGKSCNLIVFDITMEQAGVYKCMPTGGSDFASILTVIDSPPAITVNTTAPIVEKEKVVIECSLVHNGSTEPAPTLRPYFLWQNKYGDNISSSYASTTENTALSRITVTAGHNNISSYTCHVYLQLIPSTDPGYASNIPSVNSSAISPIIEVLWITAAITDGPSNTVAEIGDEVQLNCTTDVMWNGDWFLSKDGTSNGQLWIVGQDCVVKTGFEDHYETESLNSGNSCNLIVFNITMEQAGVYKCMPTVTDGIDFASILTVIDSPPAITVNTTTAVVEDETVSIECSLVYNGSVEPGPALRPYFYWTSEYGRNVSRGYDSTTESTALSQITIRAHQENISSYTCHVYLQLIASIDSGYANNIPSVNISASSPIIEVLYAPSVMYTSTISNTINIGGIDCEVFISEFTTDGNPPPTYEWFDAKENVSVCNGSRFDLVEMNRTYTMTAYNTIRDVVHSLSFNDTRVMIEPQACKFPRNESTWSNVTFITDCDDGTCACSDEYNSLTLTCNAQTYPNASYKWIGPDNSVFNSQVLTNVTSNGVYHCIAYFDQTTSDYTGDAIFPNGTRERNVRECWIAAPTSDLPINTVAEIGQQVQLNCTTDQNDTMWNGDWFLSKDGSSIDQLWIVGQDCVVNTGFEDHYQTKILSSGKSCSLIVFDIAMEQAGVYKCLPTGESYFASILTVIDSPPAIAVNTTAAVVEKEKVVIGCSLVHNGSIEPGPTLRPYFYWTDKDGRNVSSSYDSTTDNTALSQLTITAGRESNIWSYTCHVYVELIPSIDPGYANNTPSVNSSARSPTIEVFYGPDVSGFSNDYLKITIGGTTCGVVTITCIADGNPPPSYEWIDNGVSISNDATLYQVQKGRSYECVAKNTIRNKVYSDSHVIYHGLGSQDCRFPHSDSTWIDVTLIGGCDDGKCACYDEFSSLTLTCNADTYPNASYKWIGHDNSVFNTQVLTNVTSNGVYHCIAYFEQTTSNYTGDAMFPNGTSVQNVTECYPIRKPVDGPPPEMMDLLNGT